MEPSKGDVIPKVFQTRTIQGTPYEIDGHTLVPVARVVSMGKARGTIGANSVSGWAGAFARIVPVSILVRTETADRRVAIVDATSNLIGVLLAVGLISTALLAILRRVARRLR